MPCDNYYFEVEYFVSYLQKYGIGHQKIDGEGLCNIGTRICYVVAYLLKYGITKKLIEKVE